MRLCLKIALLLFISLTGKAQYQQLESLWQQLKNAPNDTASIALYSEIGTYYDDVNVDSSVYYNEAGIAIARQLKLKLNEAELLMNMSFPLAKMGNYPKTLKDVPATSEISDSLAKELKKQGFKFLGSTVMYAHMQATGMVNDHIMECWTRK